MKTVPVPSIGRMVLYAESETYSYYNAEHKKYDRKQVPPTITPAIVLEVDSTTPQRVCLRVFNAKDYDSGGNPYTGWVDYGEGREGHWWWPPRVDGVMEVEE